MSVCNPNAEQGPPRIAAAEDEAYDNRAQELFEEKVFDSDDLNKLCDIVDDDGDTWSVTPVIWYCREGNSKMCRSLIARGADCRKTDKYGGSPMLYAAANGHLEIVQFLCHECGAHEDIRRVTNEGISPLRIAFHGGHVDVWKWLIRNGALSSSRNDVDDGGIGATMVMRRNIRPIQDNDGDNWRNDKRLTVLAWAQTSVATYDTVKLFLRGTIVSAASFHRHPKNPYATRSNKRSKVSPSPLVLFKGKSGILELIAHYIAGTPQQLRTLRQLVDRLPVFIADVPFVIEEEEDDEDEEDY